MASLITRQNIAQADDIYQRLIDMNQDLSEEEWFRLSARLILVLINHIGDPQVVFEAIDLARGT